MATWVSIRSCEVGLGDTTFNCVVEQNSVLSHCYYKRLDTQSAAKAQSNKYSFGYLRLFQLFNKFP